MPPVILFIGLIGLIGLGVAASRGGKQKSLPPKKVPRCALQVKSFDELFALQEHNPDRFVVIFSAPSHLKKLRSGYEKLCAINPDFIFIWIDRADFKGPTPASETSAPFESMSNQILSSIDPEFDNLVIYDIGAFHHALMRGSSLLGKKSSHYLNKAKEGMDHTRSWVW